MKEGFFAKLKHNLPWLARYPLLRINDFLKESYRGKKHLVITIANHFEPAWTEGGLLPIDVQKRRLDDYYDLARKTGEALRDSDGNKFSHTNFYPAEQYNPDLLSKLAQMQREGLGEVEIHLHHGVDKPDTSKNTRNALTEFRDVLAEEHKCLSRVDGDPQPKYAFVHGNLALANSAGGVNCGVDDEMKILQETGCYIDMTLPSAPDKSQVPVLNKIYECGFPLDSRAPHRKAIGVEKGRPIGNLPILLTGPLVFDWYGGGGLPLGMPRLDDGALAANRVVDLNRLKRWVSANVTVRGRPDWVFIKLYCHGFYPADQQNCIGDGVLRQFEPLVENGEKTNNYKVHFASAREAFNMIVAAVDGKSGDPGLYRNYRLKTIMDSA